MSQVQIKEIINSFCKIIKYFKFSSITPEDFRLAKFNKPIVDRKLWKFLHELLQYVSVDKEFKQEFNLNIDSIRRIQISMVKLGYNNSDFNYACELLNDSDEEGSSREILLACAWLISTQDLISLFIQNVNHLFEEEYFKDQAKTEKELSELDNETDHLKSEYEQLDDVVLKLNYLKRLEHRFRAKLNSLHSALREKSKLTHEIHDLTKFSQQKLFGNLSCLHVNAIKHSENAAKLEKILEEKLDLLTTLEYWLDNEDIFWEWMESVVDEKLESTSSKCENRVVNNLNLISDNDVIESILVERKNLEKLLSNLKAYTRSFKQKIIDENLDASINAENGEMLKRFQDDLEANFKCILESVNLSDFISTTNKMLLSISSFENILVLTKTKLNKTTKPTYQLQSIQVQINHLENKINFLNLLYLENKKNIQLIIEKHINDLKDSYAIYF